MSKINNNLEYIVESAKNPEAFIKECEDRYNNKIEKIARNIAETEKVEIVMLAGPSSAGKTTTAKKLNSGDAFDCDVNGDGKYDPQTERFYYVSKLNGYETSNVAVLIYYNNTTNGIPDNTSSSLIAYHSEDVNNLGPVTGVVNLPTVEQWSNVKLSNITRQITNQEGGTTTTAGNITSFTYKNTNGVAYAGRLLTAQEVNSACKIKVGSLKTGELDSCNYLMENTKFSSSTMGTYGYWLESPRASDSSLVWFVYGYYRSVYSDLAIYSSFYGVRPAIEILESDISY